MPDGTPQSRVVVVGAGPVGMVCALALNRRGIPVTVFEQEPAPVKDQRAASIHPPTLELLDAIGITGTIIPLIDRGFVPDFKRIREALGVPADTKDSVFYEQYDTEPVINVKDPAVVEPLKARMQAALAKLA